jgi:Protein of unknown function (DUF2838)
MTAGGHEASAPGDDGAGAAPSSSSSSTAVDLSQLSLASPTASAENSPRRSPEEWLDYEEVGVDLVSDDVKIGFDFAEWRKAKIAPFVRRQEKFAFFLGVLNVMVLNYFTGTHQWVLPYYYTVKAPLLIALRYFSYRRSSWHWFLLDFCYYANALLLAVLWAARHEPRLFMIAFSVINGPLLWAVPLFRNSLVFHSIDKTTSVFIHLSPVLLSFVARWYLNEQEDPKHFGMTVCLDSDCRIDWRYNFAFPVAFFAAHQVLYYLLVHGVWKKSIEDNPRALTTYRYLMRNKRSPIYKLASLAGPRFRRFLFSFWYTVFAAVVILPTFLMYRHFAVNLAVLAGGVVVAVWNGGCW